MQCRCLDCGYRDDDGGPPNRSNQQPKEPGHTGLIVTGIICSIIIVGFLGKLCRLPQPPCINPRFTDLGCLKHPGVPLSRNCLQWPCVAAAWLPVVTRLCMHVPGPSPPLFLWNSSVVLRCQGKFL